MITGVAKKIKIVDRDNIVISRVVKYGHRIRAVYGRIRYKYGVITAVYDQIRAIYIPYFSRNPGR